jgi:hypothetical protein
MMKKLFAVLMSVAVIGAFTPVEAQTPSCPPEVAKAKDMLSKKGEIARAQDIQAPRTLAGARGQDVQAPRGQDVQAPRGQDVQAPRGQDIQAPRGQDVQAPRTAAGVKSGGSTKAAGLVREAEAACKAGDMGTAKAKAEAAITELK